MKICFVIPPEGKWTSPSLGGFSDARTTAAYCQSKGHDVTILLADAVEAAEASELRAWGGEFSAHSLAAEIEQTREPFFPNLLRNSWLTYQWLKAREFDRIYFQDDTSAGLIPIAAKRLGEAFEKTRLVFRLNGPAGWTVHLRDRGRLVRDDVTLPYAVQYGVENADQLVVPAHYFQERIDRAGWVPSGCITVLPYLPRAAITQGEVFAGLRLVYPVHDSDHAPLAAFLQAVSALAPAKDEIKISFLCFGNAREQRNAAKRVLKKRTAEQAANVVWEFIDGSLGLPVWGGKSLWLVSPMWLNLPFPLLEALNRGEALLVANTTESRQIVDTPDCLVEWVPDELKTRLAGCLKGELPRAIGSAGDAIGKVWQADFLGEAGRASCENPEEFRVSICVAHFNKARDLRQALDSLGAQSHRNMEVIVVDDASTDPDAQAAFDAAEAAFGSHNWKFIRESSNRGPGYARNQAVQQATGSHVLFFDADDIAFPDMVERLLRASLRTKGACVAGSSRRLCEVDGRRVLEGTSTYVGGSLENAFLYPPAGTVFIIEKDIFDAVGGFKTDLPTECHEDWNFHVRLLAREIRVHVLPEPIFAYRSVALSRSLLVPQDMSLLLEPLLECTPQVKRSLLNSAIESAGALETAQRRLANYEQLEGGLRLARLLIRCKRALLRPFGRRRKN